MPDLVSITPSCRPVDGKTSAKPMRTVRPILVWLTILLASPGFQAMARDAAELSASGEQARPADGAFRQADPAERDAVRSELRQAVTEKTRHRLETMKKRKALPHGVVDTRLARLAAAEDPAYLDRVARDAKTRLRPALGDQPPSQYFVYVDRNPARQLLFVGYYDAGTETVELLGADLVSTGLLRRGQDSFLTPTGVFEHLPDNFGYRAKGTKNERGWRGLGGKGSRVWDFGFQQGPREFRRGVYESQMRLLMHATDPDHGEPRLGGMDSKGCVRVSADMNRFLDRRSILDRHYERLAAQTPDMWLLAPDRIPVSAPGSFMVVGDTAGTENAAR
ncbi:MAG: L,D-transpeptidase family protein [Thermodesulfobacteriota bacterium]